MIHLFEINYDFANLIARADLVDFNKMRTNQSFRIRLLSWQRRYAGWRCLFVFDCAPRIALQQISCYCIGEQFWFVRANFVELRRAVKCWGVLGLQMRLKAWRVLLLF